MIIALSFAAGFSLITVSCTPQQSGATLSDLILKCHLHINLRYQFHTHYYSRSGIHTWDWSSWYNDRGFCL